VTHGGNDSYRGLRILSARGMSMSSLVQRIVLRKATIVKVLGIVFVVLVFVAPLIAIAVKKVAVARNERTMILPKMDWVIGPFGPDLQSAYEPEKDPNPAKGCRNEAGVELKWKTLAVVDKVWCLDFRKQFKADNSVGYALTYVFSAKDQEGEMLLGSDDT